MPEATGIHAHERYKLGHIPHDPARATLTVSLRDDAPAPPASIDHSGDVRPWPMFKNDAIGDCGPACEGHAIELTTKDLTGTEAALTDDEIVAFYSDVSGYVPGDDSTDVGVSMDDMLSKERKDGLAGRKPVAYGMVKNTTDNLKRAIDAFGCLHGAATLQTAQQDQTDNGGPWDYVAHSGTWGGHAFTIVGYDDKGIILITWGMVMHATWAWVQHCLEELWAVIYAEHLGKKEFQANADVADIESQFHTLTGKDFPVPTPPAPAPPAPTPPTPDPGPTPAPPEPTPPAPDPSPSFLAQILAALKSLVQTIEDFIDGGPPTAHP